MTEGATSGWRTRVAGAAAPHRNLLANAGSMVGTSVVTAGLGVVFWLVAARGFSPAAVGIASAAISAMTLFGFVSALGLGTLLMGEIPRLEPRRRIPLMSAALLVAGAAGLVAGVVIGLVAPLVSDQLDALSASVGALIGFATGVGLTALALVLDQALIGFLRGGLQLTRNVIFAVVKLAVLVVVALAVTSPGPAALYSSWTVGIAASLIVLLAFMRGRRGERAPDFAALRHRRGAAASHAAVNLGLETADLAMPILVLILLSATENAAFFIAWMITNILIMVPLSLSMVAYAIGSGETAGLRQRFRFTLQISLVFGVLANLVLLVVASPVLELFGSAYTQATTALQVMALGVLPLTIKVHYVALHRVRRTLRTALPIVWIGTALELAGGAIGASVGGLTAVAIGWDIGLCIEALVMGPSVVRWIRGADEPEPIGVVDREQEREWQADFEAATVGRR